MLNTFALTLYGAKPPRLHYNHFWQMDVTHIVEFDSLSLSQQALLQDIFLLLSAMMRWLNRSMVIVWMSLVPLDAHRHFRVKMAQHIQVLPSKCFVNLFIFLVLWIVIITLKVKALLNVFTICSKFNCKSKRDNCFLLKRHTPHNILNLTVYTINLLNPSRHGNTVAETQFNPLNK